MHVCVYSCVSQHLADRNFGGLRLVMEKTKKNKKIIDLKTALLNEAGLERNIFYFCRCVVANTRAICRLSVSVSAYILCIAWV